MAQDPFFIVGCSRSGTTLLTRMLNQSQDLHIPAESEFLRTLHDRRHEYGDFSSDKEIWFFIRDLQYNEVSIGAFSFPIFGLTEEEAFEAINNKAPTDFAGAANALFSAAAGKVGKSRWADKTPRNVRQIDWLAEAFPTSQFLHLIRDGRPVAKSRCRAGFTPSIRLSARHWKREVKRGLVSGSKLDVSRYLEARYESLVRHPESTLREICDFVNLEYNSSMLMYHERQGDNVADQHLHLDIHQNVNRPLDPARVDAWRQEMTKSEIAEVEDEAGDLLENLGYPLTHARIPLWKKGARSIVEATLPLAMRLRDAVYNMGVTDKQNT